MDKREIKFRGIDIETGKWIYGSLVTFEDGTNVICHEEVDGQKPSAPVRPETVGQSTGINDSFGNNIYEGDIIRQESNPDWHSKVDETFVIEFGYQNLGHATYQQTIGWNATPLTQYGNQNRSLYKGINDLCFNHPGITAVVAGTIHDPK